MVVLLVGRVEKPGGFGIVGLSGLDRWRTGSATHNLLWIEIWETMGGNGQNNSQKGQLAFNLHISANSHYLQLRYVNENELICTPILDLHVYSHSQLTPRVGTSNSSYQLSRANTHRPIPSINRAWNFGQSWAGSFLRSISCCFSGPYSPFWPFSIYSSHSKFLTGGEFLCVFLFFVFLEPRGIPAAINLMPVYLEDCIDVQCFETWYYMQSTLVKRLYRVVLGFANSTFESCF